MTAPPREEDAMRRAAILAVVTALGAGLLTGCADDGHGADGDGRARTTPTVGVFGAFGLEEAGGGAAGALPLLIAFLLFGRQIVGGITQGAVKG
ncbi:hypothetical protein [Streptomyces peucetius]|uniref:hypothetical protein n=1 Tax=Streptomyces peucetius TaxID=1950 RepID=UPI0039B0D53B